jgi:hypothetical protein
MSTPGTVTLNHAVGIAFHPPSSNLHTEFVGIGSIINTSQFVEENPDLTDYRVIRLEDAVCAL